MRLTRVARRAFIDAPLLAIIAAVLSSCVSVAQKAPGPQPFRFAQICDPQLGMGGYEHDVATFKQAVKQINSLKPDLVVICGDLVGRPDKDGFDDFNRIRGELDIPNYCVPGNHDVGNEPTPQLLKRYREAVGDDYYSFEHKGYVFVCVNTSLWKAPVEGETAKQDAWLAGVLEDAARKQSPVFVVGHYPLFVKSPDEPESYGNLPIAKRQELLALFEKSGVVAMLTGHAHRAIVQEHNGIQLVTGQATSRTHGTPLGFRMWHVTGPRPFNHESVNLEGF